MKDLLTRLYDAANDLDNMNLVKEANIVTNIMIKIAQVEVDPTVDSNFVSSDESEKEAAQQAQDLFNSGLLDDGTAELLNDLINELGAAKAMEIFRNETAMLGDEE